MQFDMQSLTVLIAGISDARCVWSAIKARSRGSPSSLLALAFSAVMVCAPAANAGGFLNGLAGAVQGDQKYQCMQSCAPGDGQCYQACANAYTTPQQQYNAPAPVYQQPIGMLGTLVNSRSGTSVTGRLAYECTYDVYGRRTTVVVENICPPSMSFK